MSEEAAHLAREAKGLHQGLKESLKIRDPWDKDVGYQRKNLRWQYLRLLFVHPFAAESRDAETHLWMQTSYTFITIYKRRISSLDSAMHGSTRQNHQQQHRQHGVEYRKLLQRFRQFLTDEEKFWTQLVVRIYKSFALSDAQRALVTLGIVMPEDEVVPPATEGASSRRDFPLEADSVSPALASATPDQLESRIAMLSKALVCLGDIARYKEQYNEAGGRPRAGHEDGPPVVQLGRGGRNRRGGAAAVMPPTMARMRDYKRAQECYEQARLLLPYDGNPSHQLAILASYQKDTFNSLVHYYRSLCVRRPYDTASENMAVVLSKALEQWKSRQVQQEEAGGEAKNGLTPRERINAFKGKLIAMHALWQHTSDEANPMLPDLNREIISEFKSLVSERFLPDDMISKTLVLAQGALWRHRMTRSTLGTSHGARATGAVLIESRIATHLLDLHLALLEVGIAQLAEAPAEDDGEHDLAQRITAPFRRTLPALRLAGKWVRGNVKYVSLPASQPQEERHSKHIESTIYGKNAEKREKHSMLSIDPQAFWQAYAEFSSTLLRAFPLDKLPVLNSPLEEDREMLGFLPLKNFMFGEVKSVGAAGADSLTADEGKVVPVPEQVHPNVEQLMRIWDLLADARSLVSDENSPLILSNNQFVLQNPDEVHPTVTQSNMDQSQQLGELPVFSATSQDKPEYHDLDDDNLTELSRTTDDPVSDAMREALAHSGETLSYSDDGSDDVILMDRNSFSMNSPPRLVAPVSTVSTTPHRSKHSSPVTRLSPPRAQPLSPLSRHIGIETTPEISKLLSVTAEDLLKGLARKPNHGELPPPQNGGGLPPPMLFGSGALGSSTQSIWSPSFDSSSSRYPGAAGTNLSSSHRSNSLYYTTPVPSLAAPYTVQSNQNREATHFLAPPIHPTSPIGGHRRASSMARLQSSIPNQRPYYDPSKSYVLAAQPSSSLLHSTGSPTAYMDPASSPSSNRPYYRQSPPGYLSYHSGLRAGHNQFILDPWNGTG
ncbi:hypothetical protein SCP_0506760 [Sparassis crispa]|uniref:Protein SMG7 n=1 Tax=Sparassis crispa TaxID=139825 RepID=A0A401GN09_9APHY|nr:hypothetical protein SCP_0506760 [Sparassis crispa]GBE83621.1 hypothetical protein SCP_0506760 [Sparassis crispa]